MSSNNQNEVEAKIPLVGFKIFTAYTLVIFILGFGVLELSSRYLDKLQSGLVANNLIASLFNRTLPLDDFERPSDEYVAHWGLRAGFSKTSEQIAAEKSRDGKILGAQAYKPDVSARPSDLGTFRGISINSLGFRGDELRPESDKIRILSVGDSVTFGLGEVTYPRELEYQFHKNDYQLNVINAGVEGYSIRNHMIELSRYIELKPRMAIIFLGWNDLFSIDIPLSGVFSQSAAISRINRLWQRFLAKNFVAGRVGALDELDLAEDVVLRSSVTAGVMQIIEDYGRLVKELKDNNIEVVVVTLPTFMKPGVRLSKKLMERAQLPAYSLSPSEFASTISFFNRSLKEAAPKWNVQLADVSEWADQTLQPNHTHYLDTVHISARSLKKLSLHLFSVASQSTSIGGINKQILQQ